MTDIQFYYLNHTPLERMLPKLLEKSLAGGFTTLVRLESEERAEALSTQLWTFDPDSFLPHGTAKDGNETLQPIYLTASRANPNAATLIIVTDGSDIEDAAAFKRALDIVDAGDEAALQRAQARQQKYRELGHNVSCIRQNASGGWEKLAA